MLFLLENLSNGQKHTVHRQNFDTSLDPSLGEFPDFPPEELAMWGTVSFLTLICLGLFQAVLANSRDYKAVAEYFAPAVFQQTGKFPIGDIPTRYDFDGDFYADNNWDNLVKFDIKPYVYYEVIETKTHFFITYGFFRPRDFSNNFFCFKMFCHENDLEGTQIAVRKEGQFGKIELVSALAHISVSKSTQPFTYLGSSKHKGGINRRVLLRIESGGHGIYVWDGEYPKKFDLYLPSDDDSKPRIDKVPIHYELVSIQELWNMRNAPNQERIFERTIDFENERMSFKNIPRSFAGRKFGHDLVAVPWSWGGVGQKRGEWFLDPAGWTKRNLKNATDISLDYVHHPYLELTPRP
jgi:hypothetical protein